MIKKIPVRVITISALLIATEIVLNRIISFNNLGLKIGFSFIPIIISAILFGPSVTALIYAVSDFIGALLLPIGPYFPGFTVCAALMGAVWGLFLYRGTDNKSKIKLFPNIIVPSLINNLFFGLIVNTIWISIMYGSKSYWGWFVYRISEYAILIPLNIIFVPILVKLCDKLKKYVR